MTRTTLEINDLEILEKEKRKTFLQNYKMDKTIEEVDLQYKKSLIKDLDNTLYFEQSEMDNDGEYGKKTTLKKSRDTRISNSFNGDPIKIYLKTIGRKILLESSY